MKNVENFTSRPTTRGGDPCNEVGSRLESPPERSSRLRNGKSRRERKTSHQNGFFLGPVRMLQFFVCFRRDGTAAADRTRSRGAAILAIIDRVSRLTSPDNATRIFFPFKIPFSTFTNGITAIFGATDSPSGLSTRCQHSGWH